MGGLRGVPCPPCSSVSKNPSRLPGPVRQDWVAVSFSSPHPEQYLHRQLVEALVVVPPQPQGFPVEAKGFQGSALLAAVLTLEFGHLFSPGIRLPQQRLDFAVGVPALRLFF